MPQKEGIIPSELIASKIYIIRRLKVMLDRDLVELYGIETKQLKRAVKRNIDRLSPDFMCELTLEEYEVLRCQTGTLKRGVHSKYPPFAFTEQNVAMLSSVLNRPKAIEMSVFAGRAFIKMRETLANNKTLASLFFIPIVLSRFTSPGPRNTMLYR
jgi:hypothetical protein